MKYLKIFFIVLILILPLEAIEKVSLQLAWLHQFEFAGFYMAKEKGFYEEVGLDVEIKEYKYGLNLTDEIIAQKSTYGESGTVLLVDASLGKKTKLLAALYQSSPLVFLSIKASHVDSVSDFKGKRVMITPEADTTIAFYSMINRYGIKREDVIYQKHSFNILDLVNNKTDIMMAVSSNEPFLLQELGVQYNTFDPREYEFDFYNNLIFTSEDETSNHPIRASNFTKASLKGWEYAFRHIDETVGLILQKYNTQKKSKAALLFEANVIKKLAYSKNGSLGEIDENKLQRIYDIYNTTGLIKNSINPKEMIFQTPNSLDLTKQEQEYLEEKSFSVCIQPDLFPIDGSTKGIHSGIVADVYSIISQKLGVTFFPFISDNIQSFHKNIQEKKCDLISVVTTEYSEFNNYSLTQPFIFTSMAIISTVNKPFINEISSLEGKKIIVQYEAFKNYLLDLNPNLDITVLNAQAEIAKKILNNDAECAILPSLSAEWMIQQYGIGTLKINGFAGKEHPLSGSIGVIEDNQLMLLILNKVLKTIPEEKIHDIIESWTLKNYTNPIKYPIAIWISGVSLVIFLAFLYRQRSLKKLNLSLKDNVSQRTQELESSNKLLEAIFNTTKESIAIINKDTQFLFANKAYFEMTGYSVDELYEQTCFDLTFEKDRERIVQAFDIIESQGYLDNLEKKCICKNGEVIDVAFNILVMPDSNTYLMLAHDATEENFLKSEQKKQEYQFLQQSRLAQMGEMISMIAHQWRQPLGSIASTTINMKIKLDLEVFDLNTQEDKEQCYLFFHEKLDSIEHHVENLTTTIDDFRNFYKPNKKLVKSSFKEVVHKAFKIIINSLKTNNIQIIEEYSQELPIEIYENEMIQVVLNIFKNAQDNFQEKGTQNPKIEIRSNENTLSIFDNGGGIPENILVKIFDPYFSTKNEKNGTGLGLHMSRIIVEEHHKGKLIATNKNNGVCFEINLEKKNEY